MGFNQIEQDFIDSKKAEEWTPTSVEFTDSVKGRGLTEQYPTTMEETKKLADEMVKNNELLKSLNLLKSMEEMLSVYDNSDDPNISRVVKEYKNLKKKISEGLSDKTKEIFKQAWIHLDINSNGSIDKTPLDTTNWDWTVDYAPPKDEQAASSILENPETMEQRDSVSTAVNNISSLNPEQQRLLNEALTVFKEDIEKTYVQFKRIEQQKSTKMEDKKAA